MIAFLTDSLRDWNDDFMEAVFIPFQQCFARHHSSTCSDMLVWDHGEIHIFHQLINLTICTTPQKSKLVDYVMCNYTYLKQQIVNFADGTCRDRLASLLTLQDGAFLKEVPSIAACHGLSVSLCTRCYSFGDARLVNHKQYLAGGSFLKSLGTSKWDSFHGTFIYILFQGGKRVSGSWGSEAACVVRKERFCQGWWEKDHVKAGCLGCTRRR